MITSEEIKGRLWDGANELRGSMDASRYKDYMLGLMFYKFLSDKTLASFRELSGEVLLSDKELVEKYRVERDNRGERLYNALEQDIGYYVAPEYLYQSWLIDIDNGNFELQKVRDSLFAFERTIVIESGKDDFQGLFSSSTIDLSDTALGSNLNERSENIKELIRLFADLNMVTLQKTDVLGDAYEYLIGQFAMEAGKKAGEFYTPHQISEVMAQIVAKSGKIASVYDATVGSGSLLLTVGKHLDKDSRARLEYYGQEKNTATYNLTRMNLLLHGVRSTMMNIRNGDTLAEDWPEDPDKPNEGVLFDAVVMNPPYSVKNWNRAGLKISDPRFALAGILPPDSMGDYAFLLHGLYHLRVGGTMAIVLPHGVLFRGGAEGEIRKKLLDKNYIDCIIGLPSNLFTNTGIPVTVLILKKDRKLEDSVLFIDASKEFIKIGKNNVLQEKHIAKIIDTYSARSDEKGYSALVTQALIKENDYNLNIPRYIDAENNEISHDVDAHLLGGIPESNIKSLKVLNSLVLDVIKNNLAALRPGYMKLNKTVEEIKTAALSHENIINISEDLENKIEQYIDKYWAELVQVNKDSDLRAIMTAMLEEIKQLLGNFEFVNIYDAYQNIADIWTVSLNKDLEIIAASGFYNSAKTRLPNMQSKGSGKNKRQEQDGWVSSLIPNELIMKQIFSQKFTHIEELKNKLQEAESELSELVESAKTEGAEENAILYDCLNKNKAGEAGDSFAAKLLTEEQKLYTKDSEEYALLKKVEKLMVDKTKFSREIRNKSQKLNEAIYEKILVLSNEEIDSLIYEKWFGKLKESMKALIKRPVSAELDKLQKLQERYADTLDNLDKESKELENSFAKMLENLVVIE